MSRSRSVANLLLGPLSLVLLLLAAAPVGGQEEEGDSSGALRIFLDCQTGPCDSRYFRTEIRFVDWVRIREDADVHLILTGQSLGGGARQYRFDFIGLGGLEGLEDELTYDDPRDATEDETLAGITRIMSIGLARFAALAGGATGLRVVGREPGGGVGGLPPGLQGEVDDPWDFWVFNVGINGSLDVEERQSSWWLRGRMSADRTTERWKIRTDVFGMWREREFEVNDTSTFVDASRNWTARGRAVYGLAERWSAAMEAGASASTFVNQDLGLRIGTGVEYSIFPYEEATRRQLTVRWMVFGRHFDYEEETLFERTSETRPQHLMEVALDFRQPWGEAGLDVEASQYLHDTSKNRLTVDGDVDVRVYRGLSLSLAARASRIHDQLFLPKAGLSEEEILVQRRQLATDFEYRLEAGFNLSFGSIYNNVVNNRFRRGFF